MLNQNNILTNRSQQLFLNLIEYYYFNAPKKLRIFDDLLFRNNIYFKINPSQQKIADTTGVSLRYTNEVLAEFHRLGIILKKYTHRKTCIYILNPIIYGAELRQLLCKYLNNIRWTTRKLLLSLREKKLQFVECIPIINKKYIYNKTTTKQPICTIRTDCSIIYKEKNLHKLTDSKSKITTIGDSGMQDFDAKISETLQSICQKLDFNDEQALKLNKYPDKILVFAYTATYKKNPENKFGYFFGVCKNKSIEDGSKEYAKDVVVEKKVIKEKERIPKPPYPIVTIGSRRISYTENLNRFDLWYEKYHLVDRVEADKQKKWFLDKINWFYKDMERFEHMAKYAEDLQAKYTPKTFIDSFDLPKDDLNNQSPIAF